MNAPTRMIGAGIPSDAFMTGEVIAKGSFTAKDTFLQWVFSPDQKSTFTQNENLLQARLGRILEYIPRI